MTTQSFGFGVAIDVVEDSLDRVSKILAHVPGGLYKAVGAAMKRAAKSGETAVKKTIASEYYISSGQFLAHTRETVKISGASVEFGYRGSVIPLVEFHFRAGKDGYVTAAVKRGGGGTIERAFLATVGGHTGLFERVSEARLPIEEKFGPSTPQMMYSNEAVTDEVERKVVETYEKRIEHEIERILGGW